MVTYGYEKEIGHLLLFPLSTAQKVPLHLPDERRRNLKRRKRNGIWLLDMNYSCNFFPSVIHFHFFVFRETSEDEEDR